MKTLPAFSSSFLFAVALAACARHPTLEAPEVPEALRPPAGQVVYLEALGSGLQVYECASRSDGLFFWTPRGAQVELVDRSGRPVGRHYYPGPTWEAADGSKVITELKARVPSPDPTAVAWLLSARKSGTGEGAFARIASIQRVRTVGGVAPPGGCEAAEAGKQLRMPFKATFYFYNAAPSFAGAN